VNVQAPQKNTAQKTAKRKVNTNRAAKSQKTSTKNVKKTNQELTNQSKSPNDLPYFVLAIKECGTIMLCSAQVENILGQRCEDLVGNKIDAILWPASCKKIHKIIQGKREEKDPSNPHVSACALSKPRKHYGKKSVQVWLQ
jgi:hypothetical protein